MRSIRFCSLFGIFGILGFTAIAFADGPVPPALAKRGPAGFTDLAFSTIDKATNDAVAEDEDISFVIGKNGKDEAVVLGVAIYGAHDGKKAATRVLWLRDFPNLKTEAIVGTPDGLEAKDCDAEGCEYREVSVTEATGTTTLRLVNNEDGTLSLLPPKKV